MYFLTSTDESAFYLKLAVDGKTLQYGNAKTAVKTFHIFKNFCFYESKNALSHFPKTQETDKIPAILFYNDNFTRTSYLLLSQNSNTRNYSDKLSKLQYSRTLTTTLSTGDMFEVYVNVTSVGYATTFNGETLDLTLFAKNGIFIFSSSVFC